MEQRIKMVGKILSFVLVVSIAAYIGYQNGYKKGRNSQSATTVNIGETCKDSTEDEEQAKFLAEAEESEKYQVLLDKVAEQKKDLLCPKCPNVYLTDEDLCNEKIWEVKEELRKKYDSSFDNFRDCLVGYEVGGGCIDSVGLETCRIFVSNLVNKEENPFK